MRKNRKKWDLEDLLSVVGFVFELLRVLVSELRARKGSVEHLQRLLKEPELVKQIFDLIVDRQFIVLGEDEYLIPVDYQSNPSKAELEAEFSGKGSVREDFDTVPWVNSRKIGSIDETDGNRVMRLFHFQEPVGCDEAAVCAGRQGYRPATWKEARAFAKAHPDAGREYPIVAFGSISDDMRLRVPELRFNSFSQRRVFSDTYMLGAGGWKVRFLFVRKDEVFSPPVPPSAVKEIVAFTPPEDMVSFL